MESAASAAAGPGRVTLWLSALPLELEPFLSLAELIEDGQVAGRPCWHGTFRGKGVRAALCGVGGSACEKGLAALLDHHPDARVMLVGLAGALKPGLRCGDVVVASRPASWPWDAPDGAKSRLLGASACTPSRGAAQRQEMGATFQVVAGTVLSWPDIVQDRELRDDLWRAYGADCVDMETGQAARLCQARGTPFLAVRGISDQADQTVSELRASDLALAAWRATMVAAAAMP